MHETGFKSALTRVLNNYGTKNGIIKGDDKVTGEDCREGITVIVSVKLTEAQFEGQTKAKLGNAHIRTLVNNVVSDQLEVYLEEHPVVARTILDKALTANRAREAARKARENARRKTGLESGGMPDKLKVYRGQHSEADRRRPHRRFLHFPGRFRLLPGRVLQRSSHVGKAGQDDQRFF